MPHFPELSLGKGMLKALGGVSLPIFTATFPPLTLHHSLI